MRMILKQIVVLFGLCSIFSGCAPKQMQTTDNAAAPREPSIAVVSQQKGTIETHEDVARKLIHTILPKETLTPLYQDAAENATLNMIASLKAKSNNPITEKQRARLTTFWHEKVKELMPYSVLENLLLPIVMKHLTLGEIRQINEFNQTPVGQKLIKIQPILMKEGKTAGEILGRRMANEEWGKNLAKELQSEFPSLFKDEY